MGMAVVLAVVVEVEVVIGLRWRSTSVGGG